MRSALAQWYSVRLRIVGLPVQDSPEVLCCVLVVTLYALLSTGSNHEDTKLSQHDKKSVDWDV